MKENFQIELRKLTYGLWVDGQFTWLDDEGWFVEMNDEEHMELNHEELGVSVTIKTRVYNEGMIQSFSIKNMNSCSHREVKLFLTQNLMENADESVSFFAPSIQAVVRSYNGHYLLINGMMDQRGIVQYSTDFEVCDLLTKGIVLLQPFSLSSERSIISIEGGLMEDNTLEGYFWLCKGADEVEVMKNNSLVQLHLPFEVDQSTVVYSK